MKSWLKRVLSWLVSAWTRNAKDDAVQESDHERRMRALEERGRKLFLP
jgi:hypothetical protein